MNFLKYLFAFLTLAAGLADAATLSPQLCNYYSPTMGACAPIQNDGGLVIGYLAFSATDSALLVDGVSYVGPGFPATGEFVGALFVAQDGSVLIVNAKLTAHSQRVNSGRAHYTRNWWTLDSGSIK